MLPGSSWTYSANDSFPHGQKTTYVLQASSPLKECRLSNNLAALTINEKKLHPQGDPDLTVSVFSVEKRWQQDGNRFKASFCLAADVANGGSGSSSSASRLLFLINGNQELAVLDIPQDSLPGPGQKRRFTAVVPADKIAAGEHVVQASIEPPQNERNTQNNLSPNSGPAPQQCRSAAAASSPPWSSLPGAWPENKLSTTIKMTNLQNQGFAQAEADHAQGRSPGKGMADRSPSARAPPPASATRRNSGTEGRVRPGPFPGPPGQRCGQEPASEQFHPGRARPRTCTGWRWTKRRCTTTCRTRSADWRPRYPRRTRITAYMRRRPGSPLPAFRSN